MSQGNLTAKEVLQELILHTTEVAKRHGHVLKPWGPWPGSKFHIAECTLCGSNAIADPTFKSYERGMGGGAFQFPCRARNLVPQKVKE